MNETGKHKIIAELHIMDTHGMKPNYADIARKLGLDYRTVKKYHEGYEGKPKTREKPSKLDGYHSLIVEKLMIPRITMKGVYEFLVDMYGLDKVGSYSNFKAYCSKHKLKPVGTNKYAGGKTRYETSEGDMAQCDWKENIILYSSHGELFTVNIFHLVLKFSRYSYIELTLSKDQSVVFKCLINAFKFYGGIPKRILFDNMSTVVDTTVRPKRINNKMVQFAKDMNFKIDTCKARHAFTKGTNEARNKILDWIRAYNNEFETFKELQDIVDTINVKMNINKCEGTDMPPSLLFIKEKEYLSPLPDSSVIDQYIAPSKVLVSDQQLILYKGSRYSVDRKYIGEYVQPEEFNDMLQIYFKGKLIQIHEISKNPINYDSKHYEQTLKNAIKQEEMETVVNTNLKIMDSLLETRTISITKDDAMTSNDKLVAYLLNQGSYSHYISRLISSLNRDERKIFFTEITKLLPYVKDEEQFFMAFKHCVYKDALNYLRMNFWIEDCLGNCDALTEEGFDSIKKEFEEDIEEYLKDMKNQWRKSTNEYNK